MFKIKKNVANNVDRVKLKAHDKMAHTKTTAQNPQNNKTKQTFRINNLKKNVIFIFPFVFKTHCYSPV